MKTLQFVSGIFLLALATPAAAQDVVLAPWNDDPYLYPGVVAARNGTSVTVAFDDGTSQTRHVSEMRVFDWQRNTPVQCQWTDGYFYNATILYMGSDGATMQVRYDDDGVVQDTSTAYCRTRSR
jgi:hypothetical protein